jgi:hypothetical protein
VTPTPPPTSTSIPIPTLRSYARAAGVLYLVVIVCAGFAEGVVRAGVIVPGDPAATGANIAAAASLFRLGFVADLVAFLSDAVIAVLLYVLLRPVDRTLSLLAAALRLVAHPAIGSVNLLNHYGALLVVGGGAPIGAFDPAQLEAMAGLLLDAHGVGYLIAGAFFGTHLLVLGHLLFRSDLFPHVLGVLIGIAGLGYLAESFGVFLVPGHDALFAWIVALTAVAGEVPLALWLVVRGVKTPAP